MNPLIPHDVDERLGEDDMATRREEEFREVALQEHAWRVSKAEASEQGVCTNCGAVTAQRLAVYCDEDCREDHETRTGRRR